MQRHIFLLAPIFLLAFLGAGCLGGGGASGADGGFFTSTDQGKSWTQSVAVPTANGLSSIAETNVTTFAIDPTDTSAYYLGTLTNGLFFSYDSGTTWQRPENEEARSGQVRALAVDPHAICTYYVLKPTRLMKTTTCGRTFDEQLYVESRESESLTTLALDWYNPSVVYIATTAGDIFRSTDGGETWATLTRVNDEVTAFGVNNADSRVLVVGTRRSGVQRSTDGGATWTDMEDALTAEYKDADRVYALAQTADGTAMYMSSKYGVLTSKDNGATWKALSLIPASGEVEITALGVNPGDGDDVYFAVAQTLYHSVDGGLNWTTSELPSTRAATVIAIDPETATRVLLGVETVKD